MVVLLTAHKTCLDFKKTAKKLKVVLTRLPRHTPLPPLNASAVCVGLLWQLYAVQVNA